MNNKWNFVRQERVDKFQIKIKENPIFCFLRPNGGEVKNMDNALGVKIKFLFTKNKSDAMKDSRDD
ncbi:hypothetical protein BpHYR1_033075 [Brachionus plicatilis]|uniref:Uncharacterized protein n=1 Tax=Brachionus plicatilis TaxID=10195 RepID=A0A3M7RI64_BRAPC|nr:hypothetical protein BpHYR1_033075 [Brachionus plicatilis]